MKKDTSPKHYKSKSNPNYEVWDVIQDFADNHYLLGNALKYIVRSQFKFGLDAKTDIKKAITYLERYIKTCL